MPTLVDWYITEDPDNGTHWVHGQILNDSDYEDGDFIEPEMILEAYFDAYTLSTKRRGNPISIVYELHGNKYHEE